jgi:hypothetical protein
MCPRCAYMAIERCKSIYWRCFWVCPFAFAGLNHSISHFRLQILALARYLVMMSQQTSTITAATAERSTIDSDEFVFHLRWIIRMAGWLKFGRVVHIMVYPYTSESCATIGLIVDRSSAMVIM